MTLRRPRKGGTRKGKSNLSSFSGIGEKKKETLVAKREERAVQKKGEGTKLGFDEEGEGRQKGRVTIVPIHRVKGDESFGRLRCTVLVVYKERKAFQFLRKRKAKERREELFLLRIR